MESKQDNLLDLIPEISCRWERDREGRTFLLVPRFKSPFLKKIALRLGRSEWVKIFFDDIGAKSWSLIDGKRNIHQIGGLLEKEMGDSVQPVYDRLSQFMTTLYKNKFIILRRDSSGNVQP